MVGCGRLDSRKLVAGPDGPTFSLCIRPDPRQPAPRARPPDAVDARWTQSEHAVDGRRCVLRLRRFGGLGPARRRQKTRSIDPSGVSKVCVYQWLELLFKGNSLHRSADPFLHTNQVQARKPGAPAILRRGSGLARALRPLARHYPGAAVCSLVPCPLEAKRKGRGTGSACSWRSCANRSCISVRCAVLV